MHVVGSVLFVLVKGNARASVSGTTIMCPLFCCVYVGLVAPHRYVNIMQFLNWKNWNHITSLLYFFILLYAISKVLKWKKSSESIKDIYSPLEISIPLSLAGPAPLFFWFIKIILLSFFAYFLIICSLLSLEPSFTHIISISLNVWLIIDSKHSDKYFSELYIGIITDIFTDKT